MENSQRDNKIYDEWIDRMGELVDGYVKRFERGDIIMDVDSRNEAVIPRSDQSRVERYSQGERIRAVVIDVNKNPKGFQIILSRTSVELIKRLFEMEIPEIYDGTVIIKAAARVPGEQAKVAVISREQDVDPISVCKGMKGSRIQSIIRELRDEKIDIFLWSDNPEVLLTNAFAPAVITRSVITEVSPYKIKVFVSQNQFILAYGKRGLNLKLIEALTGWTIDLQEEVL